MFEDSLFVQIEFANDECAFVGREYDQGVKHCPDRKVRACHVAAMPNGTSQWTIGRIGAGTKI